MLTRVYRWLDSKGWTEPKLSCYATIRPGKAGRLAITRGFDDPLYSPCHQEGPIHYLLLTDADYRGDVIVYWHQLVEWFLDHENVTHVWPDFPHFRTIEMEMTDGRAEIVVRVKEFEVKWWWKHFVPGPHTFIGSVLDYYRNGE